MMNSSNFRDISDELLSAYLDEAVTEQERAQVEAAIAADETLAWRLESLRQTVNLIQQLPEPEMPRSFVVQKAQVEDVIAQRQNGAENNPSPPVSHAPGRATDDAGPANIREQLLAGWRSFWQGGHPALRNAAAVSFALMLVLFGGSWLTDTNSLAPAASAPETSMVNSAPAGDAQANEAQNPENGSASAGEAVALAPSPTTSGESEAAAASAEESDTAGVEATDEDASANDASDEDTPAEDTPAEDTPAEGTEAQKPEAEAAEVGIASDDALEAPRPEEAAEAEIEAVEEADTEDADSGSQEGPESVQEEPAQPAQEEAAPEAEMAQVPAMPEADRSAALPMPGAEPNFPGGGAGGMGSGGDGIPDMQTAPGYPGPDMRLLPPEAYMPLPESPVVTPDRSGDPAQSGVVATEAVTAETAAVAPVATRSVTTTEPISETHDSAEVLPEEPAQEDGAATAVPTPTSAAAALAEQPTPTETASNQEAPLADESGPQEAEPQGNERQTADQRDRGQDLPLLRVIQGISLLLTVTFASLWWRSRDQDAGPSQQG